MSRFSTFSVKNFEKVAICLKFLELTKSKIRKSSYLRIDHHNVDKCHNLSVTS